MTATSSRPTSPRAVTRAAATRLLLTSGLGLLTAGLQAQDVDALKARREAKLAKPVFAKAAWIKNDLDAAKAAAAGSDRLILTYFTRSYAP